MQKAIAEILRRHGLPFRTEVQIGEGRQDRIDLLIDGGIGIELKVHGSMRKVQAQLRRYAKSEQITSLILISSRLQAGIGQEDQVGGKPLFVLVLTGGIG